MFPKILTTRLLQGRLASDHARLLCNILQLTEDLVFPCAMVSIDAEKPYDRVE